MNNQDLLDETPRKRIEITEDGRTVLISDSVGITLGVLKPVSNQDMSHLSDKEWEKAQKNLLTHDIVVDNETKKLKYVKRKQADK